MGEKIAFFGRLYKSDSNSCRRENLQRIPAITCKAIRSPPTKLYVNDISHLQIVKNLRCRCSISARVFIIFRSAQNFLSSRRRSFNWFCCWNQFLTPKVSLATGMGRGDAQTECISRESPQNCGLVIWSVGFGLGKRLLIEIFSAVACKCWFRLTRNQSAGRTGCAACGSIKRALRRSTNEGKMKNGTP